jgi:nucleoside phosphorylase
MCRLLVQPLATGGQLINDGTLLKKLVRSSDFKRCAGGEMEAWGVYKGARACEFEEWIVVKGVSDFARKKSYDYQPLAAAAAVDAVFRVLEMAEAIGKIEVGAHKADHH